MDMHSNIRELHEHREETDTFAREQLARGRTRATVAAPKPAVTASGSGWYHDAAIEAARRETIEMRCHPIHW